jgi:hypothetical protein
MKDVVFDCKETLANKLTKLCMKVGKKEIQGFYRLTFNEMITFYYNNEEKIGEILL